MHFLAEATTLSAMRRSPSFLPLFLFILFLFHGAGLLFALRLMPRVTGKAVLPVVVLVLVAAVVYAMLLWANFRRIRAGTTAAASAIRRGITLIVVGALWGAGSLAVILADANSLALGLFAISGFVAWYPALLAGALFLVAVRRR